MWQLHSESSQYFFYKIFLEMFYKGVNPPYNTLSTFGAFGSLFQTELKNLDNSSSYIGMSEIVDDQALLFESNSISDWLCSPLDIH